MCPLIRLSSITTLPRVQCPPKHKYKHALPLGSVGVADSCDVTTQVLKLCDCSWELGTKTGTKWLGGIQTRGKTQDKQWQLLWYVAKFRPDKLIRIHSRFFGDIDVSFYIGSSQDDGPAGAHVHGYKQWNATGGCDPFWHNPGELRQGKKAKTMRFPGDYAHWQNISLKTPAEYLAEIAAVDSAPAANAASVKSETKRTFGGTVFHNGAAEHRVDPYPYHDPLVFISHGMYHKYGNELGPAFKFCLGLPTVECATDSALTSLSASTSIR